MGTSSPGESLDDAEPTFHVGPKGRSYLVTTARWSPCAMANCSPVGSITCFSFFSLLVNLRQLGSRYETTAHQRRRRPRPRDGRSRAKRRTFIDETPRGEERAALIVAPNKNYSGMSSAVGDVFERPTVKYRRHRIAGAESWPPTVSRPHPPSAPSWER